jgi:hypothetical protein
MNQPAKIYLSQMPSGGLAVFSGSIFGGDRTTGGGPRVNFRQRLSKMTAKDKAECCRLSQKLGAAELTSHFERMARWTS